MTIDSYKTSLLLEIKKENLPNPQVNQKLLIFIGWDNIENKNNLNVTTHQCK